MYFWNARATIRVSPRNSDYYLRPPDSSGRDGLDGADIPGTWIPRTAWDPTKNNNFSAISGPSRETRRARDTRIQWLMGLVVSLLDIYHMWCILIRLFMRPITSPVLVHIIGRRVMGLGGYRAWIMVLITIAVLTVIGLAGGLIISSKFIGRDSEGQDPGALQVKLLSESLNGRQE